MCSQCVFVHYCVCVHLDGLNAEHKFRVWVTILGHTPRHFTFTLFKTIFQTFSLQFVSSKVHFKKKNIFKNSLFKFFFFFSNTFFFSLPKLIFSKHYLFKAFFCLQKHFSLFKTFPSLQTCFSLFWTFFSIQKPFFKTFFSFQNFFLSSNTFFLSSNTFF